MYDDRRVLFSSSFCFAFNCCLIFAGISRTEREASTVTGCKGDKTPALLQLEQLLALGLDQRTAETALVNSKVTANLSAVIAEAGITWCDKSVGNLLYAVATKYPSNALVHRPNLINYIVSMKVISSTFFIVRSKRVQMKNAHSVSQLICLTFVNLKSFLLPPFR
ncbi:uncharacterized protein [Triticum aestivum]|uniref:uncharacterized protein n=1 Tax=Triticum aestivum TaxID=4565 RepID=UPI001D022CE9|nr:uncharacterized protein LOC123114686 [Triticum aestivum]XP_044392060.1 uncharacterized protein LOC123114687 [Triticum aestivum]